MEDLPADLPAPVANRLQVLAFADRAVAWLRVDDALALVGAGGDLEVYGLGALCLGAPAVGQAAFLEGLLPLVESPWLFPSVELVAGRVADLHFWTDEAVTWVLLL